MHQDRPSTTAWAVALRRAVHQLLDRPLVLDDPLAIPIVGTSAAQDALAKTHEGGPVYEKYSRVMRAVVVGRARFAEDRLARAHAAGIRQYVILGAGLDTFSYRNIYNNLRVFEVDHPATQAWKRGLLQKAAIPVPDSLTFVPVNFESQSLSAQLAAHGFTPDSPAFFSWLGVIPYLTLPAFRATLQFLGTLPAGTQVVFDYATRPEDLGISERIAFDMLAQRVAAAGEPFQLFLSPADMHRELSSAGFTHIEDLDAPALNALYFADRTDPLAVAGKLGHFLHAKK
jgi:methyltransferase (TIGR00027 family)